MYEFLNTAKMTPFDWDLERFERKHTHRPCRDEAQTTNSMSIDRPYVTGFVWGSCYFEFAIRLTFKMHDNDKVIIARRNQNRSCSNRIAPLDIIALTMTMHVRSHLIRACMRSSLTFDWICQFWCQQRAHSLRELGKNEFESQSIMLISVVVAVGDSHSCCYFVLFCNEQKVYYRIIQLTREIIYQKSHKKVVYNNILTVSSIR